MVAMVEQAMIGLGRYGRTWLALCLTVAISFSGGCAFWDRPAASEPLPEENSGMSSLRQPGPRGQILGLDERSREIERNLGVR
jgi:hypothetical protein